MVKKRFFFFVLWLEVIIWCGLIYFLSSIPNLKIEELGNWDLILRKIAHFTEYAILSILLYRAINQSRKSSINLDKKNIFWPIFLSFVYAVTDEYHQYFVPGRITSAIDVCLDSSGAIAGIISFIYIKIRRNQVKNP